MDSLPERNHLSITTSVNPENLRIVAIMESDVLELPEAGMLPADLGKSREDTTGKALLAAVDASAPGEAPKIVLGEEFFLYSGG